MKTYDCTLYQGQIDVLLGRLQALQNSVDVFVIVEATLTPDGRPKPLYLRSQWSMVRPFAPKVRYIVADDLARHPSRSARKQALKAEMGRGLIDVAVGDKVMDEQFFDAGQRVAGLPPWAPRPLPVIICPYVHEADRARVVEAFGLDRPAGAQLPFFFWQDRDLIGPERAFEHCWRQFPERDIVIVHTDMRPLPLDRDNTWFRALCQQADRLPGAAMLACDLLYPFKSPQDRWYVQCAGGTFNGSTISHIGGGVNTQAQTAEAHAYEYDERFQGVREAHWVTFGGVYIRRETIDMVGNFDTRYEWAYVMDVDYCLEARKRGLRIVQVPVNLLHEESQTSKAYLQLPEYQEKVGANMRRFHEKWDHQLRDGDPVGPI